MQMNRIPEYTDHSFDGMLHWFAEMSVRELLFHPDESADQIINVVDGEPSFTSEECHKLDGILSKMFDEHGDKVHEAAYPVFMRRAGIRLDA